MSRQEDFKRMAHSHDTESSKYEQKCYVDGAEDGYEYAVEKACEWLSNNLHLVRDWSGTPAQNYRELVRMLRKEMQ